MLLGGDVAKGGSSGEKPFQVREGGGHVKLVHPQQVIVLMFNVKHVHHLQVVVLLFNVKLVHP